MVHVPYSVVVAGVACSCDMVTQDIAVAGTVGFSTGGTCAITGTGA